MAEFANGLEDDLRTLKLNMAEHARTADSYFEGVKSHADSLRAKLQDSVDMISSDFKVRTLSRRY